MFRNFVKPGAFEKNGMRGRPEGREGACMQTLHETPGEAEALGHVDPSNGQNSPRSTELPVGNSGQSYVMPPERTNGSLSRKGGYTTSIYVNSASIQPKRDLVTSRQSHDPSRDHSQSNGFPRHLLRSQSEPMVQQCHNIQTRLSEISVTDRISQPIVNGYAEEEVIPTVPGNMANGNGVGGAIAPVTEYYVPPTMSGCNHSGESRNSNGFSGTHIGTDGACHQNPHKQVVDSKYGPYTQTCFNVIPPPPPLVEPVFAGRRDVRDPTSVNERQIVSAKGTVRGFKNRVRAGIATFWAQPEDQRNYRQLEQGKIVIYATSMSVVRDTSDRCKIVRRLLQNHMVRYEERDLYMSREIQQELMYRLSQEGIQQLHLPHVFADGIHIGGAEELEKLNEAGELRALLNNYQKINVRIMCEKCGGYRYLPCEVCHGSKRSLLRNHFTEEFCALRCMHCDESGLVRCDLCRDQQE